VLWCLVYVKFKCCNFKFSGQETREHCEDLNYTLESTTNQRSTVASNSWKNKPIVQQLRLAITNIVNCSGTTNMIFLRQKYWVAFSLRYVFTLWAEKNRKSPSRQMLSDVLYLLRNGRELFWYARHPCQSHNGLCSLWQDKSATSSRTKMPIGSSTKGWWWVHRRSLLFGK